MFGWFKRKSIVKENKIADLERELTIVKRELDNAKVVNSHALSTHKDAWFGDVVTATVCIKRHGINNENNRYIVIATHKGDYSKVDLTIPEAIQLRDFLLKHFPVNNAGVERPEVSE